MLSLYLVPSVSQQSGWFLNLFALGMPFLLLIQIGFFIFWFIAKRRLALLPVIICLLSWGLIRNFFVFSIQFAKNEKAAGNIRVATWNVHLFNFFEQKGMLDSVMLQKAVGFDADILAVQEFAFSLDSTSPASLPKTKEKLGYKYAAVANDRAFGVHTIINNRTTYYPFCVAIFSRHPILQWQKVQSLKEYNHTFLWADILIRGDTVRVFSIHLQSMHFAQNDYEFIQNFDENGLEDAGRKGKKIIRKMKAAYLLRAEQAKDVHAEIAKSPHPVIVCGDMNDVPNSYTYQTISKNLNDAFVEKGRAIGQTFKFLSRTLRIDYILYSKELQLQQMRRVRSDKSDHNPVMADFKMDGK